MENSFYDRLLIEAQELATKTNALNDFMRTQKFIDLDRQNKDLLYKQSRLMNEYFQVLGQRLEILGGKFSHNNN
jgi:phage antirepressor YoqD-like protein